MSFVRKDIIAKFENKIIKNTYRSFSYSKLTLNSNPELPYRDTLHQYIHLNIIFQYVDNIFLSHTEQKK